ncbi:MarR family winged helix-turn-helix transcriptional regulator [Nocardia sp. NPDC004260]
MESSESFRSGSRRLYFHLQTVAQRLRGLADEQFRIAGGITTAQSAALSVIVRNPGCAQRLVAEHLNQRESAITAMAARLEAGGLIERRSSAVDARAWELWPTQAGIDTIATLQQALSAINEILEAAVGPDNVDDFADALLRLERALDRQGRSTK